ncbi:MAG TPA: hypothetical protein VHE35_23875 [Kofleriaceae bacterium]|nr:hypothetical protein [Kofleriaceae bacterium]
MQRLACLALAAAGCHGGAPARPRASCPVGGQAIVYGQEDVDALAGCARLAGLTVRTAAPVELARLTALVAIDGDLVIGPTLANTTLSLPALALVGGRVRVSGNGDLSGLYLPALRRAGAVEIVDDPVLVSVSAPALAAVGGAVTLERLPALELVDSGALVEVAGPLTVARVPVLATWVGPPARVGGAVAVDAPALDADARAAIDRGP